MSEYRAIPHSRRAVFYNGTNAEEVRELLSSADVRIEEAERGYLILHQEPATSTPRIIITPAMWVSITKDNQVFTHTEAAWRSAFEEVVT